MKYDSLNDEENLMFEAFSQYFLKNDPKAFKNLQESHLESLNIEEYVEDRVFLGLMEQVKIENDHKVIQIEDTMFIEYAPRARKLDLSCVVDKVKQWVSYIKLMFLNRG